MLLLMTCCVYADPRGMAQTLGSDVPFVMLTASEVFSLEVSRASASTCVTVFLFTFANGVDVQDRVSYPGIPAVDRRSDKGGNGADRGRSCGDPG